MYSVIQIMTENRQNMVSTLLQYLVVAICAPLSIDKYIIGSNSKAKLATIRPKHDTKNVFTWPTWYVIISGPYKWHNVVEIIKYYMTMVLLLCMAIQ